MTGTCAQCQFDADDCTTCDCGQVYCGTCLRGHLDRCRPAVIEKANNEIGLRPYQRAMIARSLAELAEHKSTLAVMPTGTGKTVCFATLSRDWDSGRVLVMAHREELIFQAANTIHKICGEYPEIEMGELRAARTGMFTRSHVVVTSVQTMCRPGRQQRFDPNDFGLLICDEAHHITASSYLRVIEYFGRNEKLKVLGVTATPDRADETALGKVFRSVAFDYQIPDAIHDGWLVPIRQQFVQVSDLDFSGVRTTAGDLNGADLSAIMENEKALHSVVGPTMELAGDRQTLIFASSVKHADQMAEIINRSKPGMAVALNGETPTDIRRAEIERYKRGEFQFLCNMGLFLEGFDAPATAVIAMARPTKSRSLYAQVIGRGTRPLPGIVDGLETDEQRRAAIINSAKPSMLVIDFVGNSGKHKLVSSADILGGNYEDEIVEKAKYEAKKKAAAGEASPDMLEEIERAKQAIEEAARMRRKAIVANVKYTARDVSPFNVLDITPQREPGWHKGRRPSEKMKAALQKFGLTSSEVERQSFTQAQQMMQAMIRRRKEGLCSYKQAKLLAKYGYESNVSFAEAGRLIDAIAKNGWKRPT